MVVNNPHGYESFLSNLRTGSIDKMKRSDSEDDSLTNPDIT